MRVQFLIATGTWYHVMSFDITQCHDLTVPKLSQRLRSRRAAHDSLAIVHERLVSGRPVVVVSTGGSKVSVKPGKSFLDELRRRNQVP
jgi:hypothetical protein